MRLKWSLETMILLFNEKSVLCTPGDKLESYNPFIEKIDHRVREEIGCVIAAVKRRKQDAKLTGKDIKGIPRVKRQRYWSPDRQDVDKIV